MVTSLSTGFKFYSDNKITGKYGEVGADVMPGTYTGPGPEESGAGAAGTPRAGVAGTGKQVLITVALAVLGLSGLAALLFRRTSVSRRNP